MYDFDKMTNRRGTDCVKWDDDPQPQGEGKTSGKEAVATHPEEMETIPLWVADMDFETAPAIRQAIAKRAEHGIFGYAQVPQSYRDSICRWYERRHHWHVDPSWIIPTTGVIPAVSATIKALTLPSEKVVIMTPVYNHFFTNILNNGCQVLEAPLRLSQSSPFKGDREGLGLWTIDWEALERCCADERTRCLLLCNPHNPVGRVWTRDELQRISDICLRHDVIVIADEIHNEIIMPGHEYTPYASISQEAERHSVTCCSPSKGFNIAGLQTANIICADEKLRRHIDRAINLNECCDINPFGIVALQAAYDESEEWLDEMCQYVWGNYQLLRDTLAKTHPDYRVSSLEGTYLAWVDISASGLTSDEYCQRALTDCHVRFASGTDYGRCGEGYIRINLACPRQRLKEAIRQLTICN